MGKSISAALKSLIEAEAAVGLRRRDSVLFTVVLIRKCVGKLDGSLLIGCDWCELWLGVDGPVGADTLRHGYDPEEILSPGGPICHSWARWYSVVSESNSPRIESITMPSLTLYPGSKTT